MIRLQEGNNDVVLTLSERTSVENPVYLFVFENIQTQQTFACIAADTSQYKYRYNEFAIAVGEGDPLAGFIDLQLPGDYYYTVYEQLDPTNLDPSLLIKVEQGYMTYDVTNITPEQYNGASGERRAYQQ